MKSIKYFAFASMLAIASISSLTFTGCKKDDETCAVGFEGTDCKTKSRDKVIGTYVGHETCDQGSDDYSLAIVANSDDIKVVLANIYNQGFSAVGTMTGTNTFSFSGTQVSTTFTGTGTVSGNSITVNYSISDGQINNKCTFIGTK